MKAINNTDEVGIRIGKLHNELRKFNYDDNVIIDALNQMLLKSKRLIWIDLPPAEIFDVDDLLSKRVNSKLFLTNIGKGYVNDLYKRLDYIQEIMLDTYVDGDNEDFGSGWKIKFMTHRLNLTLLFCKYLFRSEFEEIEFALSFDDSSAIEDTFGSINFITGEIVESLNVSIKQIIDSTIPNATGNLRKELIESRENLMVNFQSLLIQIKDAELQLFR